MADHLLDTNILVAIFKGDAKLKDFVEELDCAIDTTIYVELIQGAKNKTEVHKIEKYLTKFDLVHFQERISIRTISIIRAYSKSHGLMFADAIIAATCLENELVLITRNVKDFRFISELTVLNPIL